MPRLLLLTFFTLITLMSFAQLTAHSFKFTGQILDPDSIPVENAYLVNYRTVRAYATNSEGRFQIPVQAGDSLKIVHMSYQPVIVKVSENDTTIIFDFSENIIETVTVKSHDIELEHFNKNMKIIKLQLDQMSHYNYRNTKVQNPYNSDQYTGTTGIAISDIIKLFKKRKR